MHLSGIPPFFNLESLLDTNFDVHADDKYEKDVWDNKIKAKIWTDLAKSKVEPDTTDKLNNIMNGLKETVNIKIGATRTISKNLAGAFLVKGQTVKIISYDKEKEEVEVKPMDVTGQNLHCPLTTLRVT